MNDDKKPITMFVGLCIVVLLVVSIAGCTTASPTATPTATATTPTVQATANTQSSNVQSYSGPFVGSQNSDVYHLPWCPEAKRINPENRTIFNTAADAQAAGFRPCKVCRPPTATAASVITPTPSPLVSPTPTPTPPPAKIATSINPYVPPVWYAYGLIPTPLSQSVKQGQVAVVQYSIKAANGKQPCGAANYYIDDQAAGGEWSVSKEIPGYGCPAGVSGGAGELTLHAADTAKLSPGYHSFKIDYLGDNTYAPSQYVTQFLVVK